MKITNSTVTINVRDLDRSILFYESLGLELQNRWGEHYAQLRTENLSIGLHPMGATEKASNSCHVSIGFTTDSFENAMSHLKKMAISFSERNEEGGEFLHFEDPDRTSLYFIKPKW